MVFKEVALPAENLAGLQVSNTPTQTAKNKAYAQPQLRVSVANNVAWRCTAAIVRVTVTQVS